MRFNFNSLICIIQDKKRQRRLLHKTLMVYYIFYTYNIVELRSDKRENKSRESAFAFSDFVVVITFCGTI
jgi:hypothetical protein